MNLKVSSIRQRGTLSNETHSTTGRLGEYVRSVRSAFAFGTDESKSVSSPEKSTTSGMLEFSEYFLPAMAF
ncbi:hypothetical protein TNCV_1924431 [Trichonephila clavipes]|nr:hypothetical protein TNCV_1924431 [Trichonephila clavipes]